MILASRSPQRRAILEQVGIPFTVRAVDVSELSEGDPETVTVENARRKASAAARQTPGEGEQVLGVDTIVWAADRIYGKPADEQHARQTLSTLSGAGHEVLSGLCLMAGDEMRCALARTFVQFRVLDPSLIDWYLDSGEWRGRAGGYAVQGRGAALVASVHGEYLNVVGLPLATLLDLEPRLSPEKFQNSRRVR